MIVNCVSYKHVLIKQTWRRVSELCCLVPPKGKTCCKSIIIPLYPASSLHVGPWNLWVSPKSEWLQKVKILSRSTQHRTAKGSWNRMCKATSGNGDSEQCTWSRGERVQQGSWQRGLHFNPILNLLIPCVFLFDLISEGKFANVKAA